MMADHVLPGASEIIRNAHSKVFVYLQQKNPIRVLIIILLLKSSVIRRFALGNDETYSTTTMKTVCASVQ